MYNQMSIQGWRVHTTLAERLVESGWQRPDPCLRGDPDMIEQCLNGLFCALEKLEVFIVNFDQLEPKRCLEIILGDVLTMGLALGSGPIFFDLRLWHDKQLPSCELQTEDSVQGSRTASKI